MTVKTFEGVLARIEQHAEECWDRTLPSTQVFVTAGNDLLLHNGDRVVTKPTKYAWERLLSRMKTRSSQFGSLKPHVTYNQLLHLCTRPPGRRNGNGSLDGVLFAKVVNNLLDNFHPDTRWFMRCRGKPDNGGVVLRAALSDRFKPYDHTRFMGALLNPKAGLARVGQVHGMSIGEYAEDLYLKVVCPDLRVDINGETYLPGFRFINGELGNRKIGFDPFIYRQACTNDMVVQSDLSFHQRHVGKWPDNLVTAQFATCASNWLETSGQQIEDLERLQDVEIPDLGKVVKDLKRRAGLSDGDASRLSGHIEGSRREPRNTAFDVVNGVSSFAQHVDDVDQRDDLERLSGDLYREFVVAMKRSKSDASV